MVEDIYLCKRVILKREIRKIRFLKEMKGNGHLKLVPENLNTLL